MYRAQLLTDGFPGNLSSPAGEHQRRSDSTAVRGGGDVEIVDVRASTWVVIGKPADEARAIGEFVAHHLAIGPSQLPSGAGQSLRHLDVPDEGPRRLTRFGFMKSVALCSRLSLRPKGMRSIDARGGPQGSQRGDDGRGQHNRRADDERARTELQDRG